MARKNIEEDFDIAILDWLMPKINGLQLVNAIRKVQENTGVYRYIIMVTSLEDEEYINAAFIAGADDIISKPVDPKMLTLRIKVGEKVLSNYKKPTKRPKIKLG